MYFDHDDLDNHIITCCFVPIIEYANKLIDRMKGFSSATFIISGKLVPDILEVLLPFYMPAAIQYDSEDHYDEDYYVCITNDGFMFVETVLGESKKAKAHETDVAFVHEWAKASSLENMQCKNVITFGFKNDDE